MKDILKTNAVTKIYESNNLTVKAVDQVVQIINIEGA